MDKEYIKKEIERIKSELFTSPWKNYEEGGEYENGYEIAPIHKWITKPFYGVKPEHLSTEEILTITEAHFISGMTLEDYKHFLKTAYEAHRGLILIDCVLDINLLELAVKTMPNKLLIRCEDKLYIL